MKGRSYEQIRQAGCVSGIIEGSEWHAGFRQLESTLGFALPASARLYPAWWANDARQGRQAMAWLVAGWQTGDLNLTGETVTFYRETGAAEKAASQSGQGAHRAGTAAVENPCTRKFYGFFVVLCCLGADLHLR